MPTRGGDARRHPPRTGTAPVDTRRPQFHPPARPVARESITGHARVLLFILYGVSIRTRRPGDSRHSDRHVELAIRPLLSYTYMYSRAWHAPPLYPAERCTTAPGASGHGRRARLVRAPRPPGPHTARAGRTPAARRRLRGTPPPRACHCPAGHRPSPALRGRRIDARASAPPLPSLPSAAGVTRRVGRRGAASRAVACVARDAAASAAAAARAALRRDRLRLLRLGVGAALGGLHVGRGGHPFAQHALGACEGARNALVRVGHQHIAVCGMRQVLSAYYTIRGDR